MIKSLDNLSSYSINCIVEVVCDEVLQNIDIGLFIDNFPLDVENKIVNGFPELCVLDDDGKCISLGKTTYFCDRSEYDNRKNINGFKKIQYNSKNKFFVKPIPIISRGLYCTFCMQKGPEQHLASCANPFETSLKYTVDGIENCNIGNKFSEYVDVIDDYGNSRLKEEYILDDNLTDISYIVKKKNMENIYLSDVFITEYTKKNKKSIVKIYIKNDSNIKIIINSNPWNNLGLYSKVINRINKTFENINSNYRIDSNKTKLRILSTTISVPFSSTHYLNTSEFINYLRITNELYDNDGLYEYNGLRYEILIESKKNNREILKVQVYDKKGLQGIFKYTIQLFKQSFQITVSFASDEIKNEYIYLNPYELKSKIETEITRSYNMLSSLINIFYNNFPQYLIEDISVKDKDTILTKCGKIPYSKLKLTINNGKNLAQKINDRKFIIYDVNNQSWDNDNVYMITRVNNAFELYMSLIEKTVFDKNGIRKTINMVDQPEISVPIYLIGHLLKNTGSGYKEAGTSVCEEHVKVRVREYPEDDASKRPEPYSFYGKCLGGERFYVSKLGVQSYNDNKFYPCSKRNLNMPELLNYTINYINNGQTSYELKEYIIPEEDNIDFYCGTFIPNTVYIGAVIDIKQKFDDDYHPVRIIDKIKPFNSSASTSIFSYKVIDVDESGLSEPSDEEYIINVNDIHPKYSENRRYKGLKKLFKNNEETKKFLLNIGIDNGLFKIKPKSFVKTNEKLNLNEKSNEIINYKSNEIFNYKLLNKKNIKIYKQNKDNYIPFIIPKNSVLTTLVIKDNKMMLISEKDTYVSSINYTGDEIRVDGFYYFVNFEKNEDNGLFEIENETDFGKFFIIDKVYSKDLIDKINKIVFSQGIKENFVYYSKFTKNTINLLKNNKDSYNIYLLSKTDLPNFYWYKIDNTIVLMLTNNNYKINNLNQIEGLEFSNIDNEGNVVPFINNLPLEPDCVYYNDRLNIIGSKNINDMFMKNTPINSFVQLFVNVYETPHGKFIAGLMHPIPSSLNDYMGKDKTINKYETLTTSLDIDELIKEIF